MRDSDRRAARRAGGSRSIAGIHTSNTGGATGWCLEVHGLAALKLVAGRDRDLTFVRVLLDERMIEPGLLGERLRHLPLAPDRIDTLTARLDRLRRVG